MHVRIERIHSPFTRGRVFYVLPQLLLKPLHNGATLHEKPFISLNKEVLIQIMKP